MHQSQFGSLAQQAPDSLLGLIRLFQEDQRPHKIDLGVGIFRDDQGLTPVLGAIKAAERILVEQQESKSYLGPVGDSGFVDLTARLALGDDLATSPSLVGLQTPGGNGALRLAFELLAEASKDSAVWVGSPTWMNHFPLIASTGLESRHHRFYDPATLRIDFDGMMSDLASAKPGDVLLLHGCCHNPTGATFSSAEWAEIIALCERQGLLPLIDFAYHGLGDGLEADAAPVRMFVENLPEAIVAYSCDKNFGMYRDRVGSLFVKAATLAQADAVRSQLFGTARAMWSMPPDHGAAACRIILSSPELRSVWQEELDTMRERINGLRQAVANSLPRLSAVANQRGLFSLLPISTDAVRLLREESAIYMAPDGRINIAGLSEANLAHFVEATSRFLEN
ncbi:aromatic amino acid transaminase [Sphingosinicella microcystinivorans]|uniref:Aromatic amino acid aminotransferase n=1 Tax=Sphingosinicella microcystinivorans TaxID=335406 RepID=A0AAD1FZC6_SPHMI|nr:amino acid aminotransferase [Sphingosinicella microcystinivorans]RKS88667.1 aromatic amino acid aminotransferase [Sphingosinicella microcystinivorans]BBE32414.1 aromatic amino acid aminotransferase [Sphingosinicella microcystinivorans]